MSYSNGDIVKTKNAFVNTPKISPIHRFTAFKCVPWFKSLSERVWGGDWPEDVTSVRGFRK